MISIQAVIIVSLYLFINVFMINGLTELNFSPNVVSTGFLLIAIFGFINHYLLIKINSYPVLFSFSTIAVLFIFLQSVGFGNRGHLLYLTLFPLFMIYYIYLITTSSLEKPPRFDKFVYNKNDITHEGSLSGSNDGSIDLRLAQTVIFTKTFLYTVFLFSLLKTVFESSVY